MNIKQMTREEKRIFWFAQYRRWLDACLVEYNKRFQENRPYHQENCQPTYHPVDLVEFSEDGDAYPHGMGGTNWIPKCVTPWKDSPYFVD